MKCHRLNDKRGTVLVFTTLMLLFLLIMGGIAIELTQLGAARAELQRSVDAAALAGAGKLGFDDTVFPTARQFAQQYGTLNPYRGGTVTLDLNPANAASGNIVLGIWDPSASPAFTPSLDGTLVNAVSCQFATQIPTSFLRLLSFNTLPVRAQAIATSNPPALAPEGACVFPIGLSDCAFEGGAFGSNSLGCGAAATMISSSGGGPGNEPGASNTATWVSLSPCESLDESECTPGADETRAAIEATAGSCPTSGELEAGTTRIGTNNGMAQSAFDTLETRFWNEFHNGGTYTVTEPVPGGGEIETYNGPGWPVWTPIVDTDVCPPQEINGVHTIMGWTRMVITQVINHGDCVVVNPNDTNSLYLCDPNHPNYEEPRNNLRAVFGYYSCEKYKSIPTPEPLPRSALSTRLRLVQ